MGKPNIKTIGVLTSGGDAPAMNAAVRAVARIGKERGLKVKGIRKGYNGLLNEDIIDLTPTDTADTIFRGGTILSQPDVKNLRQKKVRNVVLRSVKHMESTDW